jgi:hypothetical protein
MVATGCRQPHQRHVHLSASCFKPLLEEFVDGVLCFLALAFGVESAVFDGVACLAGEGHEDFEFGAGPLDGGLWFGGHHGRKGSALLQRVQVPAW